MSGCFPHYTQVPRDTDLKRHWYRFCKNLDTGLPGRSPAGLRLVGGEMLGRGGAVPDFGGGAGDGSHSEDQGTVARNG